MVTWLLILQSVLNAAQSIKGLSFPIQSIFLVVCLRKAGGNVKDTCFPFSSSERRYKTMIAWKSRLRIASSLLLSGSWPKHLFHTPFPEMLPHTLILISTTVVIPFVGFNLHLLFLVFAWQSWIILQPCTCIYCYFYYCIILFVSKELHCILVYLSIDKYTRMVFFVIYNPCKELKLDEAIDATQMIDDNSGENSGSFCTIRRQRTWESLCSW